MKKGYLDYNQKSLDKQYDLRPLVPHHEEIFKRYIRDSELTVANNPCALDVCYGNTRAERLDIFTASGSTERKPVLIFIHGGYWRNKDKADYRYLAPAFTRVGVNFVLFNYTLAPNATMDKIVEENQNATLWVYSNIQEFGGDPERIFISGHSAGGHLVAMLMATNWKKISNGMISKNIIRGATAVSGIFDLEPIRQSYLNESLQLTEAQVSRNSPIGLEPYSDIPLILSLGGEETDEYHRQQKVFFKAWVKNISDLSEITMPGLNHYDVIDHLSMPGSALHSAVLEQIESH